MAISRLLDAFYQENFGVAIMVARALGCLLAVSVVFYVGKSIYRLNLHPLREFAGLREAAISDRWLRRVTKEKAPEEVFEALHQSLNCQALRIAPNELHISDVSLYKVIYSQSNPFPKLKEFYDSFNAPHSSFTEANIRLHKERRRKLSPSFSYGSLLKLEPIIREKVMLLGDKIDRLAMDSPVDCYDAFRLLTAEVVMQFGFARSVDLVGEDPHGFHSWFLDGPYLPSHGAGYRRVQTLISVIPRWMMKCLSQTVDKPSNLRELAEESFHHFQRRQELPHHPVVFDNLRGMPDDLCISEAMNIIVAGVDTTAFALTTGILQILSRPEIHKKLVGVLEETISRKREFPLLLELQKIDYLNAVVKETLRFSSPVPGRLPRVVPNNLQHPLVVDKKVVPPGTIVSISAYTMHTNTQLWGSDARLFNPERWLTAGANELDQYHCTFSKGVRSCLGQNIAIAELTITLAWIFYNYHLSLPSDFVFPPSFDGFVKIYLHPGAKVNIIRKS